MAKEDITFALPYAADCPKSLSMEAISSLAREICSPIDSKLFCQGEMSLVFKSNDSYDSSHYKKGKMPNNYHSWPKTYTRQRRMKKSACKEGRAKNEDKAASCLSPCELERGKLPYHSGTVKRVFESTYDQGKYMFSDSIFYDGGTSSVRHKRLHNDKTKAVKDVRRSPIGQNCPWNYIDKGRGQLSVEVDKEDRSIDSMSSMISKNKLHKNDKQRASFFLVANKMDFINRLETNIDSLQNPTWLEVEKELKTGGSLYGIGQEECGNISNQTSEAKNHPVTHRHKEKKHNSKIKDEEEEKSQLHGKIFLPTCDENDECTDISNGLKSVSLRDDDIAKSDCGERTDKPQDLRITYGANYDYHLNGDHTEESSESSDSGVGNARYDIMHDSWNKPNVSGPVFKKRLEILKQWYIQFDNDQRNIILKMLLENSQIPQMHMLSEIMEHKLHKDCPPNCQDILTWLPTSIIHHILKFLDPVSLAQASQVNKTWYEHCEDGRLWRQFCSYPDMQLSPAREREQIMKHTNVDGTIQWKKVFILRYCLRRNWLNGKCKIRTFTGHTQAVFCVQFDETRIVSGSSDKTIKVWDIKDRRSDPVLTLVGHSGTVRCLHLNGNRLVSGSADATIKVWDLLEGRDWSSAACKVTMVGHVKIVRCLQVDHEKIVSGSYDRTLKLWDIKTGLCKTTFRGHSAPVLCVQFDDEKIVSGSADKTIKVWSIESGSCLNTIAGHTEAVTCLQFNEERIFSGSLDCSLKFWDLCKSQGSQIVNSSQMEGNC